MTPSAGSTIVRARPAERSDVGAQRLLRRGELAVPEPVCKTARFLESLGVGFVLSRNPEARSCRDAARKRTRGGWVGIPLEDEMKSFFGHSAPARNAIAPSRRYVMVHCRGDRRLDLERVAIVAETVAPVERVGSEELARFGFEYGLVNPFEARVSSLSAGDRLSLAPVLHIFDRDLLHRVRGPGTVMTNAGDLTWAVEFRADELFGALQSPHPSSDARLVTLAAHVTSSDDPRATPAQAMRAASGRGGAPA